MNKEKTFMYGLILERLLEWKTRFDEYMQARRKYYRYLVTFSSKQEGSSGKGHTFVRSKMKCLNNKDLGVIIDICANDVREKLTYAKPSIVIENIVLLGHMTDREWNVTNKPKVKTMNAQQLLKLLIIERACALYSAFNADLITSNSEALKSCKTQIEAIAAINEHNIDGIFENVKEHDAIIDATNEVRDSSDALETHLTPQTSSREYDIDVMALKIEGKWVAFDYYYGGGKFGQPESAIDWMSTARIVQCDESVVQTVKRAFSENEVEQA